jgi:hypothetical protein
MSDMLEIERQKDELREYYHGELDKKDAEIERLRARLKAIADGTWNEGKEEATDSRTYARRALEAERATVKLPNSV